MIVILSPTKNMTKNTTPIYDFNINFNQMPSFLTQTEQIYKTLKNFTPQNLELLMNINSEIALNTYKNILEFDIKKVVEVGTPAILTYAGLAFKNINPFDFSNQELNFANENVYILSGFYGALKALDCILPYRLEMKCKIKVGEHNNLYKFWKDLIYKEIFKLNKPVINLASDEYSKVITPYLTPSDNFISVNFVTLKNGKFKTIATAAKALRGQMTRYIIKNCINNVEDLKNFTFDEYYFDENLSSVNNYVFIK